MLGATDTSHQSRPLSETPACPTILFRNHTLPVDDGKEVMPVPAQAEQGDPCKGILA